MLRSNSLAIRVRWVIAARKGRAQVAQRVGVGPGGSWRPDVRVIAKQFGVDHATVQRISRPFAAASVVVPPKIFSKEVAQNRPPHLPRQQPHSPPKIVSDQISGDGAWMNFRFSRASPPGGLAHVRADDLEAFPSGLGHAASGTTYLPTR